MVSELSDEFVVFPACWQLGFLAVIAELFCEALRNDCQEGVCEIIRVHAHINESDSSFRSAVGVERTEYKMPCERSLDGDLGRFAVPHFANHNNIGIGPKK